jgi:hypothetical protein
MASILLQGIPTDPVNSLRALIGRELRQQMVAANQTSPALQAVQGQGIGHEYWVEQEAGFDADAQHALTKYLLLGAELDREADNE